MDQNLLAQGKTLTGRVEALRSWTQYSAAIERWLQVPVRAVFPLPLGDPIPMQLAQSESRQ